MFSLNTGPPTVTQKVSSLNCRDDYTIPEVTSIEVFKQIHLNLKLKKFPGFNLKTIEILKHIPNNIIRKLTPIFNASFRCTNFHAPSFWKITEVLMIPEPEKPQTEVKSCRPSARFIEII